MGTISNCNQTHDVFPEKIGLFWYSFYFSTPANGSKYLAIEDKRAGRMASIYLLIMQPSNELKNKIGSWGSVTYHSITYSIETNVVILP